MMTLAVTITHSCSHHSRATKYVSGRILGVQYLMFDILGATLMW